MKTKFKFFAFIALISASSAIGQTSAHPIKGKVLTPEQRHKMIEKHKKMQNHKHPNKAIVKKDADYKQ